MAGVADGSAPDDLWHLTLDDLLVEPGNAAAAGGAGPYVITLSSSTAPLGLPPSGLLKFDHLQAFQVQHRENGQLRYRLKLGPITNDLEADVVLAAVREHYPRAWVASADKDDLHALSVKTQRSAKGNAPAPSATPAARATPPMPAPPAAPAAAAVSTAERRAGTPVLAGPPAPQTALPPDSTASPAALPKSPAAPAVPKVDPQAALRELAAAVLAPTSPGERSTSAVGSRPAAPAAASVRAAGATVVPRPPRSADPAEPRASSFSIRQAYAMMRPGKDMRGGSIPATPPGAVAGPAPAIPTARPAPVSAAMPPPDTAPALPTAVAPPPTVAATPPPAIAAAPAPTVMARSSNPVSVTPVVPQTSAPPSAEPADKDTPSVPAAAPTMATANAIPRLDVPVLKTTARVWVSRPQLIGTPPAPAADRAVAKQGYATAVRAPLLAPFARSSSTSAPRIVAGSPIAQDPPQPVFQLPDAKVAVTRSQLAPTSAAHATSKADSAVVIESPTSRSSARSERGGSGAQTTQKAGAFRPVAQIVSKVEAAAGAAQPLLNSDVMDFSPSEMPKVDAVATGVRRALSVDVMDVSTSKLPKVDAVAPIAQPSLNVDVMDFFTSPRPAVESMSPAAQQLLNVDVLDFAEPVTPKADAVKPAALPEPKVEATPKAQAVAPFVRMTPKAVAAKAPARTAPTVTAAQPAATPNRPTPAAAKTLPPVVKGPAQPAPRAAARPLPDSQAPAPIRALHAIDRTQTLRALTPLELADDVMSRLFVIQLAVSDSEFSPENVPSLGIFEEYRLYAAVGLDGHKIKHALRLGFFTDETAASAVAGYLRGHFEAASVKRVSEAERERFADRRITARKDAGATGVHAAIELSSPEPVPTTRLSELQKRS